MDPVQVVNVGAVGGVLQVHEAPPVTAGAGLEGWSCSSGHARGHFRPSHRAVLIR